MGGQALPPLPVATAPPSILSIRAKWFLDFLRFR